MAKAGPVLFAPHQLKLVAKNTGNKKKFEDMLAAKNRNVKFEAATKFVPG